MKKMSDLAGRAGRMRNFPVEKDGRTYWVSRSVAVLGVVLTVADGELYVLVNRRGEGCPDYNGMWNIPCGYLDYDETSREAVSREIMEECGVFVEPSMFGLFAVNDDPSESRQNVTLRYVAEVPPSYMSYSLSSENSEENEVSDIRWIKVADADRYEWAFNHRELVKDIVPGLVGRKNILR